MLFIYLTRISRLQAKHVQNLQAMQRLQQLTKSKSTYKYMPIKFSVMQKNTVTLLLTLSLTATTLLPQIAARTRMLAALVA